MRGGERKMQTILKGGIQQKGDENERFLVLASRKEVEYFLNCGNHSGKDNILFFNEGYDKEVFLLLHGSSCGKVQYNGKLLSLKEVYHELRKENVLPMLSTLNIKHIFILCCHGYYQSPHEEDGFIIEPYFNNKGEVVGSFNPLFPNIYYLETEESKVA